MIEKRNSVLCEHGVPATLSFDKTYGRQFYRCPYSKKDDCGFIEWLDKEEHDDDHARQLILELSSTRDQLEGEVRKLKEAVAVSKEAKKKYEAEKKIAQVEMEAIRLKAENESLKQQLKFNNAKQRAYDVIVLLIFVLFLVCLAKKWL